MISIKTEYSFRKVFGHIDKVAERCAAVGLKAAAIADYDNTFGHVQWRKSCEKHGIHACYGVTLRVYVGKLENERKADFIWTTFIAQNNKGLRQINELVSEAYANFYYVPRLSSHRLFEMLPTLKDNMVMFSLKNTLAPDTQFIPRHDDRPFHVWAGFDNYYPEIKDRIVYELSAERFETKTTPQHILTKEEWLEIFPHRDSVWDDTQDLLLSFDAQLTKAPLLRFPDKFDIRKQCKIGAKLRNIDLTDPVYKARMNRELLLIKKKDYIDYFAVVADLINYAKEHMLVGPSRGSSAGSLVCYLLGITEIDPIPYGLIFERFIDVTRLDLPDIDIDFPDDKRWMVIEYLENKYGKANIAHICNISRLKPKSAIGEFAKALQIPTYETQPVKDAIIERSGGDARVAMCIKDTLESTDAGKEFIKKYPPMALVEHIEAHARHSGVHAAGIIVCNDPITKYVGFNSRDNVAMVDKKDAEELNLLKIDILGLRTLTILEQTLEQIDKGFNWLYNLPLDDADTFTVFNNMRLAGVFQFEGYALQSLTRQMEITEFNDIVAITSLARPGPLHCGGATDFIERRTGRKPIKYLHDSIIPYTEETFGTIVYQEQVLQISREVGKLSWEDTNQLRRALSKSLGDEFFNKYKVKFLKGAKENGMEESEGIKIWENMCTFGSWAFNKSHAVSYGLISYWTAYLKAHYPLEFAVAMLNNVRDDSQGVKLLRDMVENEGLKYKPVDAEYSMGTWSVNDGLLIGGLVNLKGIGAKKAQQIIDRRKKGLKLTPAIQKIIDKAETPYNDIFPVRSRFADYYKNPSAYNINSTGLSYLKDVQEDGSYIFIGLLVDRNLRDLNEYGSVVKRGGKIIKKNNLFLNFTVEDDTDSIICTIDRYKYQAMGKTIAETGKIGEDFYLIKGKISGDWRKIYVEKVRKL
jgi:DNA polymerase III alpha subunit